MRVGPENKTHPVCTKFIFFPDICYDSESCVEKSPMVSKHRVFLVLTQPPNDTEIKIGKTMIITKLHNRTYNSRGPQVRTL
jgi:hypothetical protein